MTGTPTLYIFPHAGGSPAYYKDFSTTFTGDLKRIGIPYPGKGGNHDLATFTTVENLADRVFKLLAPLDQSGGPAMFFGHSMGALLAFEVASRFEAQGNPIAALFVSGTGAPGHAGFDDVGGSDSGLLDAVAQMTGVDRALLENEAFQAQILPTLRGLKSVADYRCAPDARLSCPIFAYHGDDDGVATAAKVAPWAERTTGEFSARVFSEPGHHFYLNDHLPELVGDIEGKIAAICHS
ncbi:thioesterase [Mycobacterium sp. M1]|uniref:Thioesterase TesA n=1 Tax=Mycolicibacter acidiphilus TaxID=2835306 RepID=A0ABS5RDC7_9MYCO|nr:alpha/beta fold hydrolase [Mycolicibacter acidiphilus]MBS9532291.1 thioesterase [Mycolicibacter acidiphilus]